MATSTAPHWSRAQPSVRHRYRTPSPAARMMSPIQMRWATQSGKPSLSKSQ